jgi:uncharacterized protein
MLDSVLQESEDVRLEDREPVPHTGFEELSEPKTSKVKHVLNRKTKRTAITAGGSMQRRTYCVYNATRECFLSLNVKAADTILSRLRGFIGKFRLKSDEGIWVVPSQGVHTLGLFFPIDLIYLDENHRVIHLVEYFRSFRIGPIKVQAESVLELPIYTIYSSHTQSGDQLVICVAEEMEERLNMTMAQDNQAPQKSDW